MADETEVALDAIRAFSRTKMELGATADDIAGALLVVAAELLLAEYGSEQFARLLRSLGDAVDRGAATARTESSEVTIV